jgi:hypothetical protein
MADETAGPVSQGGEGAPHIAEQRQRIQQVFRYITQSERFATVAVNGKE